jgi:hypothetical protein
VPQPEVEMQEIGLEEEIRVAIVGAGGYGRVALDVLLASGLGDQVLGFYDDAHAAISDRVACLVVAFFFFGFGLIFFTDVLPFA